jgi:phage tail tape-measure protein
MSIPTTTSSSAAAVDADLAEQARPGHGIPSQDPSPAAQVGLEPEEAEREASSVFVGGGVMAGAAAGATVGAVAGGPVGVVLGGALGAVAGALGGQAAGALAHRADATDGEPPGDVPLARPPA